MGMDQRLYYSNECNGGTILIRINQVRIKPGHTMEQLQKKAAGALGIRVSEIRSFQVVRRSVDARKKPEIYYNYVIDVESGAEARLKRRPRDKNIDFVKPVVYHFPSEGGSAKPSLRPVIAGCGPAGLFCAYLLARSGYRPLLLERGADVETRKVDVEKFWKSGMLNPASNVVYGEGGAGTFSDGKLNTLVKDRDGRIRFVLETFVKFGADESILYDAKPHLGTDRLSRIVKNMREEIILLGGEVHFHSEVTDLVLKNSRINGVVVNGKEQISCNILVLAIGHSARNTFEMLWKRQIAMEAKSFAVGFRVEHPQNMINRAQYGMEETGELGAASYKLTAQTGLGRSVYSFCMCPGGYVVNASSEEGHLVVNGMSYSGRDGVNANSAVIVSVTPNDYPSRHPLAGIAFQRELEEKAFQAGQGSIPIQRYGDFKRSIGYGKTDPVEEPAPVSFTGQLEPALKGTYKYSDLSSILPKECSLAFIEGMEKFGRQIPGFARKDTILSGVESRTSSPVRILRDEELQSNLKGVYPCGEGAGYAGGITSAAMDGIKVAEMVAKSAHSLY